jgi:hypothetical protein
LGHITPGWLWHDTTLEVGFPEPEETSTRTGGLLCEFPNTSSPDDSSGHGSQENERAQLQIARDRIEHIFWCTEGTSLDLSELNLLELPKVFDELAHLTLLTTSDNSNCIQFRSCSELYLSGNRLNHLPDTLFRFRNLRVLCIRRNQLTNIPPSIRYLTELEELSVGGNQISCLPIELFELKHLKRLYVRPNPFLENHKEGYLQRFGDPLSLIELTARHYFKSLDTKHQLETKQLPRSLESYLSMDDLSRECSMCYRIYVQAYLSDVIFLNFLSEKGLAFQIKTCSQNCFKTLRSNYTDGHYG